MEFDFINFKNETTLETPKNLEISENLKIIEKNENLTEKTALTIKQEFPPKEEYLSIPENNVETTNYILTDSTLTDEFFEQLKYKLGHLLGGKEVLNKKVRKIIENSNNFEETIKTVCLEIDKSFNNILNPPTTPIENLMVSKKTRKKGKYFQEDSKISLIDKNNYSHITIDDIEISLDAKRNFYNVLDKLNLKKQFNLCMANRVKNKIFNKYKTNSDHNKNFIIPDEHNNLYQFHVHDHSNNFIYVDCSDLKCTGKGKIEKKTMKFILTREHNKPYINHSYYRKNKDNMAIVKN